MMNEEAAIEITKPLIQNSQEKLVTRIQLKSSKSIFSKPTKHKKNGSGIQVVNTVRFSHLDSRHFLATRIIKSFFTQNFTECIICLLFMVNFCFIVICDKPSNFLIWVVFAMLIKSYVKILMTFYSMKKYRKEELVYYGEFADYDLMVDQVREGIRSINFQLIVVELIIKELDWKWQIILFQRTRHVLPVLSFILFGVDFIIKIASAFVIKTYFGQKVFDKMFIHVMDLLESSFPICFLLYDVYQKDYTWNLESMIREGEKPKDYSNFYLTPIFLYFINFNIYLSVKFCNSANKGMVLALLCVFISSLSLFLVSLMELSIWKILSICFVDCTVKIVCLKFVHENDFYGVISDSFKNWQSNDFVRTIDCFYYSNTKMIRALNTGHDYTVCRIEMYDLTKAQEKQKVAWRYLNSTVDDVRSTSMEKFVFQVSPTELSTQKDIKVFSVKAGMVNKVDLKFTNHVISDVNAEYNIHGRFMITSRINGFNKKQINLKNRKVLIRNFLKNHRTKLCYFSKNPSNLFCECYSPTFANNFNYHGIYNVTTRKMNLVFGLSDSSLEAINNQRNDNKYYTLSTTMPDICQFYVNEKCFLTLDIKGMKSDLSIIGRRPESNKDTLVMTYYRELFLK